MGSPVRVTAQTRQQTRETLFQVAKRLFLERGFEQTTTRDIAAEAGIAAGTLFNYFPSKESLAFALLVESLDAAGQDFETRRRGDESLEEDLFLLITTGLRRLAPYRSFFAAVLQLGLSPFTQGAAFPEGERFRAAHLEKVVQRVRAAPGVTREPSFVELHLYWTLYLGVLTFWATDSSPDQQDTLVLIDQAMRLFGAALADQTTNQETIP